MIRPLLAPLFLIPFCLVTLAQAEPPSTVAVDTQQLKHPVKACLFEVTGNGLTQPSYLFGTIHLGQKNVVTLHPTAQGAYDTSDAVYTEIDMDTKSQMAIAPLLMRTDGKTLTEALGADLAGDVQEVLSSINPALTLAAFDRMKTWVLAATLPILEMQLTQKLPLDARLYQDAIAAGKTVGALETAESQATLFDQFSEDDLQAMLKDTVKVMQEDSDAEVDSITKLLNVYLTGDIHEIGAFVNAEMAKADTNPDFTKRLMKALLDDRNVKMADKIDEFLQQATDQSHFFAVGAAHYTGETAIQTLLEKQGYQIAPKFD